MPVYISVILASTEVLREEKEKSIREGTSFSGNYDIDDYPRIKDVASKLFKTSLLLTDIFYINHEKIFQELFFITTNSRIYLDSYK